MNAITAVSHLTPDAVWNLRSACFGYQLWARLDANPELGDTAGTVEGNLPMTRAARCESCECFVKCSCLETIFETRRVLRGLRRRKRKQGTAAGSGLVQKLRNSGESDGNFPLKRTYEK
ncbi:unnamed protein product [Durusdinium trenchii]|uniref:Uncharacterized protein n=1 Tax=Durusdinium trenchii TaxID=1381693 RepID=A0ABP0KHN3_9DINO